MSFTSKALLILARHKIVDAVSIRERPAEAKDRAIPGHWEGDLLAGAKNSYVATLVERHSRFLMLVKVSGKETEAVVAAWGEHVRKNFPRPCAARSPGIAGWRWPSTKSSR
jgi:IS30 family transposase